MRAWMLALAGCAIILDLTAPPLTDLPEAAFEGGQQILEGYVCAPATADSGGRLSFLFCPAGPDIQQRGWFRTGAVRVTTDGNLSRHEIAGAMRLTLRLEPPIAPLNTGGGGYERWLYQQRIQATAELVDRQPLADHCGLACQYHQWRIELIHRLERHLSRMRHPELAEALLLGSRARLGESHWDVLEATGTQHLVAISGLHLGLVAMLVGRVLAAPAARTSPGYPRLGRWLPLGLVLVGALGYALLAGFTVPTQRALVMVAVTGVLVSGGRQWRLWDGWLLAAVFVIALEPRALLGMGFWFSFGAVACLILAFGSRQAGTGPARSLLIAQFAVVAGLMPVMLGFGLQPSLLALPANLIAIPMLSLVVMPLLLLAAPLVLMAPSTADWVEPGLDLIFRLLWGLLTSLAELEWSFSGISVGAAILLAIGILVALGPVGWRYRGTIAGAALVVLTVPVLEDTAPDPGIELRFPDGVGGPVALVRLDDRAVLFDARAPVAGYRERTRDRIFPWLSSLGVERLEAVILSHPGVRPEVHWNFSQGPVVRDLIQAHACGQSEQLELDGVVLNAWRDPRGDALTRTEQACNLIVRLQGFRAVLFGPIRRSGERRLLASLDKPDAVELLLAPRGGAGRSSQRGLIEALDPRWAILSPADWSPSPPAAERYRQAGVAPLVSAETGEVVVSLGDDAPRLTKARSTSPWHPAP
ncbi:competence protein ComEC [Halospina denitrificans]|uniref:Competence protein ComEC n=1 Tax=Halospina denitrificans TaxID=332522 RepID=A0A4R7JPA5_9GAMM|nr:ComEC/Rec2 family competence protein [Halospina denitrificans]TDT39446.1 competence protein ComEC [Halospina denitrificans]